MAKPFVCVSWNIHRGRGGDGRVDPDRVIQTLGAEICSTELDVLCLQEADAEAFPHAGVLDVARIEAATGLRYLHGRAGARLTEASHGFLGLVTYLHPKWTVDALDLVDLPGLHPRGAVILEAHHGRRRLRLVNTHLSLSQLLRIAQLRTLGQFLARAERRPTILCGDFNEWRPWGGLAFSARVLAERYHGPVCRTFPVGRPMLPLDRILVNLPGKVSSVQVLDGPGIRASSDHRPILGRVAF